MRRAEPAAAPALATLAGQLHRFQQIKRSTTESGLRRRRAALLQADSAAGAKAKLAV